jgi:hypothetical protein
MAENTSTKIIDIQINTDKALAELVKMKAQLADLKTITDNYKGTVNENSAAHIKASTDYKILAQEIKNNESLLLKSTIATKENSTEVQRLTASNAQLLAERSKIDSATVEGRKKYEDLTKKINDNDKALKELGTDMQKNKANIGNYTESIVEASKQTKGFTEHMGDFSKNVSSQSKSMGILGSGVSGVISKGKEMVSGFGEIGAKGVSTFKTLNTAVASTGIGLLVVLISSLVAWFTKSTEGSIKMKQATAAVGAVIDVIVGALVKLGSIIVDVFTKPKELIKSVGQFLQDQIFNRIESFSKMGGAIVEIFSGNMKKGFADLGKGFLQAVTGVEDVIGKVEAMGDAAKAAFAKASEAAHAAIAISDDERKLAKEKRESLINEAKIQNEINKQRDIAIDKENTKKERTDALKKALEGENELAAEKLRIAEKEFKLIDDKVKLTKLSNKKVTADQKDELAQAEANLINVENERLTRQFKMKAKLSALTIQIDAEERSMGDKTAALKMALMNDGYNKQLDLLDKEKKEKQRQADEVNSFYKKTVVSKKDIDTWYNSNKAKLTAEESIANMDNEIAIYKEKNKTLLDGTKALNEEILNEEEKRLNDSYELDTKSLDAKLKAGQLTQAQYDLAIIQANNAKNESIKQNNQALYDYENSQKLAQIEADMILNSDNILYEFEANEAALYEQYLQERGAAVARGEDVTNIDRIYSKQRTDIAKLEADAKMALAEGFAGNLKTIFGEETAIGKAAAIAETTINTYRGATAAYASLAAIPVVGVPLGIAAAGAAIATGLANVKKIMAVKTPGGGGGGGSMPSGSTSGGGATTLGRGTLTAEVGQGIVSRSVKDSGNTSLNVQPVLPVDNVTIAQNKAMQNNKTGTI